MTFTSMLFVVGIALLGQANAPPQSAVVAKLKAEFDAIPVVVDTNPDRPESLRKWDAQSKKYEQFRELLKQLCDEDRLILEDHLTQPPVGPKDVFGNVVDKFGYAATQALIVNDCERGKRKALTRFLAKCCPWRIYHRDLESWLTYYSRETMPDGILVLFDAYEQSTKKEVREQIAGRIRHGFRAFGLDTTADDDYVIKNCKQWYIQNKHRLEPNVDYARNPWRGEDRYKSVGLFVWTTNP